jgi:hypothetical protein
MAKTTNDDQTISDAEKRDLIKLIQQGGEFIEFEERRTGAYIFENQWQSMFGA